MKNKAIVFYRVQMIVSIVVLATLFVTGLALLIGGAASFKVEVFEQMGEELSAPDANVLAILRHYLEIYRWISLIFSGIVCLELVPVAIVSLITSIIVMNKFRNAKSKRGVLASAIVGMILTGTFGQIGSILFFCSHDDEWGVVEAKVEEPKEE